MKNFIIGVELLTGLVIGAAAAAVAVSFIIVFLVDKDLAAEKGYMATAAAYAISNTIDAHNTSGQFENIAGPLVQSGSLEAAVVLDSSGDIIAGSGISSDDMPVTEVSPEWHFVRQPGSDLLVGVKSGRSSISILHRTLIIGLAALAAALIVLAIFTPRYLTRTVISPLRDILVEADRFSSGSGADAEAAGASFHRLVELLHEREEQLNELKEKAEQRAERIEKRSGAILSVLGSAVFAIDGKGFLSLFNRQSKELFELSDDDIGKEFPWKRTKTGRKLEKVIVSMRKKGNTSSEFQARNDDAVRTDRMYSVEISRSRTDEIAILVTDVTRISELEKRIADETAMADIGAASAGISHEMGNTLCALSGFVDLLARGHSDVRTQNILSEVKREVDSAQGRISSLEYFARSPEPVSSDLGRDDILSICREACRLNTDRCSIIPSTDEFSIKADSKLLASCICNVVKNAIEADPSSAVEISIGRNDKNLMISVADTGPGLSIDSNEVFRPFMTTKNRISGNMGLGLSVSRRIIRSMGGELSGENRAEGGALFTILLPVRCPEGGR